MSEVIRYVDERLSNSITSPTPVANPIDKTAPLNFTEWLQYNNFLFTSTEDFLVRYQTYLNNWFKVNQTTTVNSQAIVQSYYTSLINEIVLNYATTDEQRFLKHLDLQSSRDLALAIPFFAQKIKDICVYYSTLRDTATTATTQYNLKGSNFGIETTLYNLFVRSLTVKDIVQDLALLNVSLSAIRNDTVIGIEELYDQYSDYYDINPLATAQEYGSSSDLRAQYFGLNQYGIDPDLFLSVNVSILRAIFSYPFYLIELGENLYIDPAVSVNSFQFLKDSDYTELVSVSSVQALNFAIKAQEMQKYIGSDFYYVQTNSTSTSYVSGLLFNAQADYANIVNKRFPTVAAVPSLEYIRTDKEIGTFFKPDKLGLLHFTNFNFYPTVNTDALKPNTIYYFPDPYKYGNVSGNTKLSFNSPLLFREDNSFNKIDFSNGNQFGDPYSDPYLHTFRAYQSREQSLNRSAFGISRYEDAQDYFTGEKRDIWANIDVFPLVPVNTYPIDLRSSKLLSLNKTLVQYKTDIFGNEFGLYKEVEPARVYNNLNNFIGRIKATSSPSQGQVSLIVDGHVFNDPVSGYNFDYSEENTALNYSGVTLKTVTAPSTAYSFRLDSVPTQLYSYIYVPEIFNPAFVKVAYECNAIDMVGFVLPNGKTPPDFPSDSGQYNPTNANLYYSILLDGGVSRYSPDVVATFNYKADFTFNPPLSSITVYDCHTFLDNGEEACLDQTKAYPKPIYTEFSNFANIRLPNRDTVVDFTLSGIPARRTIYQTRHIDFGDLYYRNSNSSVIEPASAALSAVFHKYPTFVQTELNNELINFDIYYDTIQFETTNYVVFERITFDYATNLIDGGSAGINYLYAGDNTALEKFSSVWFIENQRELIVCKTTLHHEFSATNYKAVFPKIYSYKLDKQSIVQLYPLKRDENITFNDVRDFSLSGKNIEVNIVEIEKPVIAFNDENNQYTITYLGKDLAGIFYVFNVRFKYIEGTLKDISSTMYKTGSDIYTENFANPTIGNALDTYSVLGSAVGSINFADNTFNFCGHVPEVHGIDTSIRLIPPGSFTPQSTLSGFNVPANRYSYFGFYKWDACLTDPDYYSYEANLEFWRLSSIPNFVDGHVVFAGYNSVSAISIDSTGLYAVQYPIGTVVRIKDVYNSFKPQTFYSDSYGYFASTGNTCGNTTGKKIFSLLSNNYPLSAPGTDNRNINGIPITLWYPVTSTQWGDPNTFLNSFAVWVDSMSSTNTGYLYRQTPKFTVPTNGYYTLSAQGDNVLGVYLDDNFVLTYNRAIDTQPVAIEIYLTAGTHTLQLDLVNTGGGSTFVTNPAGMAVAISDASHDVIWTTRQTTVYYTITGNYSFNFYNNGILTSGYATVYDPVFNEFYEDEIRNGIFKLNYQPLNLESVVSIETTDTTLTSGWVCVMVKDGITYNLGTGVGYTTDGGIGFEWTTPQTLAINTGSALLEDFSGYLVQEDGVSRILLSRY